MYKRNRHESIKEDHSLGDIIRNKKLNFLNLKYVTIVKSMETAFHYSLTTIRLTELSQPALSGCNWRDLEFAVRDTSQSILYVT